MTTDTDNCWDAFGSDDDDDDDDDGSDSDNNNEDAQDAPHQHNKSLIKAATEASLYLVKSFLHTNSQITVAQRSIGIVMAIDNDDGIVWEIALKERGFTQIVSHLTNSSNTKVNEALYDAVIMTSTSSEEDQGQDIAHNLLIKGGILVVVSTDQQNGVSSDPSKWMVNENQTATSTTIFQDDTLRVTSLQKRLTAIQENSCLWHKAQLPQERQRVQEATIPISVHESQSSHLSDMSVARAVQRMQDYGYCILPSLLSSQDCQEWGQAVLNDLHQAGQLLLDKEGVDIFHPHSSQKDPQSYRELSMREDLRMDLRDGPQLRKMRGGGTTDGDNKPIVVKANHPTTNNNNNQNGNPFFREHPSILEVVRRTMNPQKGTLYKGNFGRYNFEGSGPDGSYQDMRLSAIGGIVSLPGSADQALHADTPHLFEHATLPAHYINAFTLGCSGSDDKVGCTAFVHGSHKIEFTAQYLGEDDDDNNTTNGNNNGNNSTGAGNHKGVFGFMVRPQLELGDVLLFDCRILHFGLGNSSSTVERPLLYCNMTHAWFHDPKNWDNHHPIFPTN